MTPIELPKEKPSLRETLRVLPSALYFIYSLDRTFASLLVIVLLVNVPIAAASVVTIKRLTDALAAQNASEVWLWMGLLVSVSLVMISEALRGRRAISTV
jgi:hypothetical protein